MRRRSFLFPFFIFFLLALGLFFLARNGILSPVTGFFEQITIPAQQGIFGFVHHVGGQDELTQLKEENRKLRTQLAKNKELEKENDALQDQFKTTEPDPKTLLPAIIIGMPGFIPGESVVTAMIINRGSADGLKKGDIVIYEENLIGKIEKVSMHLSVVSVITKQDTLITVKTAKTGVLGLVQGQNSEGLLLGNVVLSDKLEKNDLVVTKGDVAESGKGYPPDLVVGKIISVNKKASDLFQSAQVESLVEFDKLEMVFVQKNYE